MLFNEARWSQRVDPAGSHLSLCRPAPIAGYIATYSKCYANSTAGMYVLTSPRHLDNWLNWTDPRRLINCLEADPSVDTACNNTCFVAIVGYHGNPVYQAVAWILICVSITWLPKFLTCGRFPWEAPTNPFKSDSEKSTVVNHWRSCR
jgi:hypothetical protein